MVQTRVLLLRTEEELNIAIAGENLNIYKAIELV